MTDVEQTAFQIFNHNLELLRIASNALPMSGGRIAWLEGQSGRGWLDSMTVAHPWLRSVARDLDANAAEAMRKSLISVLRSEKQSVNSPTVKRLASETTTLDINPDVDFKMLTEIVTLIHQDADPKLLKQGAALKEFEAVKKLEGGDLSAENLREVYSVYLKLTDGKTKLISTADLEAAIAGDTENFRRAVIKAHNQRLKGLIPVESAARIMNSPFQEVLIKASSTRADGRKGFPTEFDSSLGYFNATDSVATRWDIQTRLDWSEAMARVNSNHQRP